MAKPTLVDGVSKLEQRVQGLVKLLTNTSKTMSTPNGGMASTGSNFLNNSLAAFSTTKSVAMMGRAGLAAGVAQGAGEAVGGLFNMMPNVEQTMNRMSGYYNASIRAGGAMSRQQMATATFSGLKGGLTSVGSDQRVASLLAQGGVMAGTTDYQRMLAGIKSSATLMNIGNESAAASMTALYSGSTSSSLTRSYGIMTSDANGNRLSQNNIYKQFMGRMFAGRSKMNYEDTLRSINDGMIGDVLSTSPFDDVQKKQLEQMMLARSEGFDLNFEDPESIKRYEAYQKKMGRENPNLSGYALNTADTSAMDKGEESYLAGIKAVTPALVYLKEAAGDAAAALGALKSGAGLFGGSTVGAGLGNMLGGALGMAGNLAMIKMAGGLGGKGKAGGGPLGGMLGGMGKGTLAGGVSKLAKVGGVTSGVLGGLQLAGDVASGQGWGTKQFSGDMGSMIGGVIGSVAGSFIPIPGVGTIAGGIAGSALGGAIGGMFGSDGGGGAGGDSGTQGSNTSGAPKQLQLIHPINPAKITAVFGQKVYQGQTLWPDGHRGVDYAAKENQTIFAAADGEVVPAGGEGALGNYVKIKHANGMHTFYCHLNSITAKPGPISKGAPVGLAGKTGRATGVHLHFALSKSDNTGGVIDPAPYMVGSAESDYSTAQTSDGSTPAPSGSLAGEAANASGDVTPPPSSNATNLVSSTKATVKSLSGTTAKSSGDGVESWSSSSVYGGSASSASGGEGIGGENFVGDHNGFDPDFAATESITGGIRGSRARGTNNYNTVTINLTISKATPDEAKKFTQMLKKELEQQTLFKNMARS